MSSQEFQPDWASSPGDTIADILQGKDLSALEFAKQIGATHGDVQNLLQGRSSITIAIARQLERVLGASVEFWMSRDFQYREDISRIDSEDLEWVNKLPVGDMIKFGWITPVPHPSEEKAACLRFFNVTSVAEWRHKYADVQRNIAFSTSPSFDSSPASVTTWLRQGEILSDSIECEPWNKVRFQESLSIIRPLTIKKDPKYFLPELQRICASNGVAVAIVRAPAGCRASGATKFISPNKALILLSFRHLTDDHFWFTFFHEAGHLIIHDKEQLFLEGYESDSSELEHEANMFSVQTLIPSEHEQSLMSLTANAKNVIRFAVRIGISPGIIVGQLQHTGKIDHSQLNRLKRRFNWSP